MTRLLCRFCLEARRSSGRQSDRSTERIHAPQPFLDEVARAGGAGPEFEKMLGDA
jgi:hypothetical protein